jgi:undecaprenyl-diphosphatase
MNVVDALILGIVEGLTEYLPISSTGHLIATSHFLGLEPSPFLKAFEVGIQSGAILSVIIVYWRRFFLNFSFEFYKKIFFAFLPAAVLGLLLKKTIEGWLGSLVLVALTTLLGGLFLVWMENRNLFTENDRTLENLGLRDCLLLGLAQALAMVPGTSRSGATIVGGLFLGLRKTEATEMSFFLGVPTLLGASLLKIKDVLPELKGEKLQIFAVGWMVSFIVAIVAIKGFIRIVSSRGLTGFGYYRIFFGAFLFWFAWSGH